MSGDLPEWGQENQPNLKANERSKNDFAARDRISNYLGSSERFSCCRCVDRFG